MEFNAWIALGIVLYVLVGFFVAGVLVDEEDTTAMFITEIVAWPFILMLGLGMVVGKLLRGLGDKSGGQQ